MSTLQLRPSDKGIRKKSNKRWHSPYRWLFGHITKFLAKLILIYFFIFLNYSLAYIIVGIAAKNDEHLDVLATLAELIEDPDDAKQLWNIEDIELIYEKFKI